jgi:hypothetical protein
MAGLGHSRQSGADRAMTSHSFFMAPIRPLCLFLAGRISTEKGQAQKMKRVRVITTAVPAALGMVIPAAAYTATAHTATAHHPITRAHGVHPDTASKCFSDPPYLGHGISCLDVIGTSNFINTMYDRYWSSAGNGYVGYKDAPSGHPAVSKWRDSPFSRSPYGFWWHKWSPDCSFPTGVRVYAYSTHHNDNGVKDATSIRIFGSSYNGKKSCL